MLNLIKKYPELLDLRGMNPQLRNESLRKIFCRDIQDNPSLCFRGGIIYPLKNNGIPTMDTLFQHLTCHLVTDQNGIGHREYEEDRSVRLHWVKPHIDENIDDTALYVFQTTERDARKRQFVNKLYIYNQLRKYVVVLERQRDGKSFYLLTAYYLNQPYAERQMNRKMREAQRM